MILTEQDAMKKRCPEGVIASNGPIILTCLGSGCMAWRWSGWRDQSGTIFANSTNRSGVEHVGYCGKAGTPWR